ncbi:MAG: hypothetical protein WCP20_08890 [Desulfuromonadales bacterium]
MNIAFIVAMPEEFRSVICHVGSPVSMRIGQYKACSGTFAGHDIMVLQSGMGFDNAAKGAATLIGVVRPDIVISAGFCGGIAPDLGVGDVVVATRLAILTGGVVDEVQVEPAAVGRNFVAGQAASTNRVFGGLFISTPVVISKAHIAAMLPDGAPHPVVEMESAAIALIAAENGIPFIGFRSVSDPADEELGFSPDEFCDPQMRVRPRKVLLTVLRKPHIIPQLFRLAGNSRIAAKNLSAAVRELLLLF